MIGAREPERHISGRERRDAFGRRSRSASASSSRAGPAVELSVEPLQPVDLERAAELLDQYPQIGFADATIAAMAERLHLPSIVTTDRRHFSMLRPAHVDAFELLP